MNPRKNIHGRALPSKNYVHTQWKLTVDNFDCCTLWLSKTWSDYDQVRKVLPGIAQEYEYFSLSSSNPSDNAALRILGYVAENLSNQS